MNSPLVLLLMIAAGIYAGKLWRDDLRTPSPHALPGAAPAPPKAVVLAIAGVLFILAAETLGEQALGLAAQQSRMTWLFGLNSVLSAPIIEELIFRGYLVVEGRGRAALWAGATGASLVFAAMHPFLWRWDAAGFALTLTAKGWFSTAAVFATSLWLYTARFAAWNPARSLLPCFAAHAAKNVGVFVIKAATGYLGALW